MKLGYMHDLTKSQIYRGLKLLLSDTKFMKKINFYVLLPLILRKVMRATSLSINNAKCRYFSE